MALHYQTEYRLGSRGRISRSYTGVQAFLAICFDLIFGLAFDVVSTVVNLAVRMVVLAGRLVAQILRLHWKLMVAAMTLLVYIVTLPFAALHEAVDRVLARGAPNSLDPRLVSAEKPEWAWGREV
jgi:hypothetical protein